jgi:hypothetical protein
MAKDSFKLLQETRNRVDTCHTGWMAFAEACIPSYNAAYKNHSTALSQADAAIRREKEHFWLVLGMVLGVATGFWGPRLLKPVAAAGDELVKDWMAAAFSGGMKEFGVHAGSELGKEVLSHAQSQLKLQAQEIIAYKSSSFKPVVEEAADWGSRLKEGIHKRALQLLSALDKAIEESGSWSVPAAEFMQKSFYNHCPFITDMPSDTGDKFKADFQQVAELSMWDAWGMARDEKWWKENPNHKHLLKMGPIFDRLVALGVPASEIAIYQNWRGTSIASARRPGWRFDMIKFIEWSKKYNPAMPTQAIEAGPMCKKAVDNVLTLKKQTDVCYAGDAY